MLTVYQWLSHGGGESPNTLASSGSPPDPSGLRKLGALPPDNPLPHWEILAIYATAIYLFGQSSMLFTV